MQYKLFLVLIIKMHYSVVKMDIRSFTQHIKKHKNMYLTTPHLSLMKFEQFIHNMRK